MTATDRSPVEVELKYRVLDLAAAERYLVGREFGPFTGGAAVRSTQIEDRYVDTADGALAKAGFAARLRQTGRGTIVSVKALAARGWRRAARPAARSWRGRPTGPRAARLAGLGRAGAGSRACRGRAALRTRHDPPAAAQADRPDGDTRVEFSLDEVDVVSRSRVVDRFVELEAELVKGDEDALAALADVFDADPALVAGEGSKLEAALAACSGGATRQRSTIATSRRQPGPAGRGR